MSHEAVSEAVSDEFLFVVAEVTMPPFFVDSTHQTVDEAKVHVGTLHPDGNWEVYAVERAVLIAVGEIAAGETPVVVERRRGGVRASGVPVVDAVAWVGP